MGRLADQLNPPDKPDGMLAEKLKGYGGFRPGTARQLGTTHWQSGLSIADLLGVPTFNERMGILGDAVSATYRGHGANPGMYDALKAEMEARGVAGVDNPLVDLADMNPIPAVGFRAMTKAVGLADDYASRMARAKEMGFNSDVFHETTAQKLQGIADQGFDLNVLGARRSEDILPDGVYTKSSGRGIGLTRPDDAEVQMPLKHSAQSLAKYQTREDLQRSLMGDPKYKTLAGASAAVDDKYRPQFDEIWNKLDGMNDDQYKAADEQMQAILDKWNAEKDALSADLRKRSTEILKERGHDGVYIAEDAGSFGRKTDTTVILDPANIRSRFAMFDPAKKNSANILAGVGGAGLAGLLMQPDFYLEPRR
jgi:hypothetical protein